MILCPHNHLGAPQVIYLEIKRPSPSSLFLEPFYTFWHMLDSIWHPKCPPSYLSIIPTLLRGLFFILWIYLVGLSPKGCSLYIILSLGASFGQIRQYESLRGSCKSMRGSFHSSSSLGLGIYLSKDFGPTICGMIWMIKCILMCGIFSLSLLELLFGKFMDGYTLFVKCMERYALMCEFMKHL